MILNGSTAKIEAGMSGCVLDYKKKLRSSIFFLTVVFVLVGFYVSMVLTNWGNIPKSSSVSTTPGSGYFCMWIQAVGGWVAIAFYLVALLVEDVKKLLPKSVWDMYPGSDSGASKV